jgi:hypothetical protein
MQRRNARPSRPTAARRTPSPFARVMPVASCALLAMGLAACSSPHSGPSAAGSSASVSVGASGTSTSSSAKPTPGRTHATTTKKVVISGLIAFNGRLDVSGAHSLHATFRAFPGVTRPKSSCAHIAAVGTPAAKGQPKQFIIPAPPQGGDISFAAEVQPYHGPGTYHKSSIVAVGASVIIGSASYNLLSSGAIVSVTVNANGSGTLIFKNAAAAQVGQSALSGRVQWTCSE